VAIPRRVEFARIPDAKGVPGKFMKIQPVEKLDRT
jgi:hypothetical protein